MKRLLASKELRFLFVGGWNTVFGIAVFAALFRLSRPWNVHYAAVYAVAMVLAVTNAYVCYKLLVFRTSGGLLAEYLRFCSSYTVTMAVQFGVFALLVSVLGVSPIPAQIVVMAVSLLVSWAAHSRFTFRPGAGQKE